MDIGTGIAIAGAWIFAGILGASNTVTSFGMWAGIIIAGCLTIVLLLV